MSYTHDGRANKVENRYKPKKNTKSDSLVQKDIINDKIKIKNDGITEKETPKGR